MPFAHMTLGPLLSDRGYAIRHLTRVLRTRFDAGEFEHSVNSSEWCALEMLLAGQSMDDPYLRRTLKGLQSNLLDQMQLEAKVPLPDTTWPTSNVQQLCSLGPDVRCLSVHFDPQHVHELAPHLMGAPDPLGVLEPHQVFFMTKTPVTGPILCSRSPPGHPGDMSALPSIQIRAVLACPTAKALTFSSSRRS